MTMTTTTKEAPLFLHSKGRCCDFEPEDFELAIATVMMNLASIQGQHPGSMIFRERLSQH